MGSGIGFHWPGHWCLNLWPDDHTNQQDAVFRDLLKDPFGGLLNTDHPGNPLIWVFFVSGASLNSSCPPFFQV